MKPAKVTAAPGGPASAARAVPEKALGRGFSTMASPATRRQVADDRAARLRAIEHAAGRALVRDMDDAAARLARRPQQALGPRDRVLGAGQGQR